MVKKSVSIRERKQLAEEIDKIGVYLDSGMFNEEQKAHFKEKLKSLQQLYGQPE